MAAQATLGVVALLLALATAACAPHTPPVTPEKAPPPAVRAMTNVVQRRLLSNLANPRAMLPMPDRNAILVALAGTGEGNSGAIARFALSSFADQRHILLDAQPSANALDLVRRDEVFGMAALAAGDGMLLASRAFFGGPSKIFRLRGNRVSEWSEVPGNINSIAYDPTRTAWFAASSTSDEIVRLLPDGGSESVLTFPSLAGGQDAVPGYLRFSAQRARLLVTLFSGSTEGEQGGDGTEMVRGAGSIVEVDVDTREVRTVVRDLTAPTDLAVDRCARIFVLELCDSFVEPLRDLSEMHSRVSHGGFRRFSGRLLAIDTRSGQRRVVLEGLDAPTNLALAKNRLYIAGGMGTPGRMIPGPNGPVPLQGYIDVIDLTPSGLSCPSRQAFAPASPDDPATGQREALGMRNGLRNRSGW